MAESERPPRHSALESVVRPGRHGFGATAPKARQPRPGVVLSERRGLMIAQAACWPDGETATLGHLRSALGIDPPIQPGTSGTRGDRTVLWLAPRRWLVVAPESDDLLQALVALDPEAGAITDLGHSRVAIRMSGPAVRDALSTVCRLDLHPRVFAPRACATTEIAQVATTLHRGAEDTFDLYSPRSSAQHVWECLVEASLAHGLSVDVPAGP